MKNILIQLLYVLSILSSHALTREEWEATQTDKDVFRLERAWQQYDIAQRTEAVTNITPATVMTNLPSNYEARLAIVPTYLAACSNLGVYGMNPLEARAALKERASAETNLATRISIGEAATDLFFLREAVAKLGIDPDAAAGSCDPIVTTNAAQTNVVFRLRSP